ncbi:Fatty acid hydroxylase domain-containing protein, partial [Podarcis lilfordi]
MDLVLAYADDSVLTPYVYPTAWPENNPFRQFISLIVITNVGALILYLLIGSLSYYFIFDHSLKKHPQYLETSESLVCTFLEFLYADRPLLCVVLLFVCFHPSKCSHVLTNMVILEHPSFLGLICLRLLRSNYFVQMFIGFWNICLFLYHLARKYSSPPRGYLCAAFLDLKAAFDSVPRNILWEKLAKLGIDRRLLWLISQLHEADYRCPLLLYADDAVILSYTRELFFNTIWGGKHIFNTYLIRPKLCVQGKSGSHFAKPIPTSAPNAPPKLACGSKSSII